MFASVFATLRADIHAVFDKLVVALDTFFGAAVQEIEAGGGQILAQAATDAVAAAEAAGGTGADKFSAAVTAVKTDLTAKGIPLIENAVQLGVLTAVAALHQTAATAA